MLKNFYEKKFGKINDFNYVIETTQRKKSLFEWRELYEAKIEALERKAREIEACYIQNCKKEIAWKQSRQTVFCGVYYVSDEK